MTSFVHVVDNGLRMQEETERIKDAMTRITAYSVGDVPHELKDVCLISSSPLKNNNKKKKTTNILNIQPRWKEVHICLMFSSRPYNIIYIIGYTTLKICHEH